MVMLMVKRKTKELHPTEGRGGFSETYSVDERVRHQRQSATICELPIVLYYPCHGWRSYRLPVTGGDPTETDSPASECPGVQTLSRGRTPSLRQPDPERRRRTGCEAGAVRRPELGLEDGRESVSAGDTGRRRSTSNRKGNGKRRPKGKHCAETLEVPPGDIPSPVRDLLNVAESRLDEAAETAAAAGG
ncbi:hypothetical protein AXG93_2788s1010 [Marchantia polymorpha subsp. ruderalis]|uniref:Uncharacterized protein n=1 Tax=Marchantia polymorpha subsp. ruderalis TaxID=1480154 RepID=A0A176WGZ5_MARPO|nr:hypothetical protein AXG93_2788s1010 [Marchantia polymorpha subsp. ruderalis]